MLQTPMLTHLPSLPRAQVRIWSTAAEAAEAAEEAPRALMMAAPRCCTTGMNSFLFHSSLTRDLTALPSAVA